MSEKSMNASFSTGLLLVIKEIRLERGIHQGLIAQYIGKTPNAWTKIENGQSTLTADALFGVCNALQIQPSYMLSLVERLVPIFNSSGWFFQNYSLEEGHDDLLKLMLTYFNSSGYEALKSRPYDRVSVTSIGNLYLPSITPTIVRYCCESDFREWINNGAQPLTTSITL
ncbi:helix-turn-helix domain-containing protein [Deefgea rivuli]|uniref:helix-turn-helix domain-containing protein n=1 Tax=Deefgea rivuli TaxID=400948 RepID=UPI00055C01B5|nr:helix-turn-helix transcriptional regulator [Deefgea rivuli]